MTKKNSMPIWLSAGIILFTLVFRIVLFRWMWSIAVTVFPVMVERGFITDSISFGQAIAILLIFDIFSFRLGKLT